MYNYGASTKRPSTIRPPTKGPGTIRPLYKAFPFEKNIVKYIWKLFLQFLNKKIDVKIHIFLKVRLA